MFLRFQGGSRGGSGGIRGDPQVSCRDPSKEGGLKVPYCLSGRGDPPSPSFAIMFFYLGSRKRACESKTHAVLVFSKTSTATMYDQHCAAGTAAERTCTTPVNPQAEAVNRIISPAVVLVLGVVVVGVGIVVGGAVVVVVGVVVMK